MALPDPEPGLVVSYSFLWKHEFEAGHEDGLKDRPCAVVLVAQQADGERVVLVVPITHSRPSVPAFAVELPRQTSARLGLDEEPSWIIATDLNRFIWPGPDLRPIREGKWDYGLLPPKLFDEVRAKVAAAARAGKITEIPRTV